MGNSPKGEYMLKSKNIINLLGIGSLCLFLLGCSEERFLVQEESSVVALEEDSIVSKEEELEHLTEKAEDDQKEEENSQVTEPPEIAVHICGAVNRPGVYYLKENERLIEGIEKAGGFREDANQDYLNQALRLEDGMKVTVPVKGEIEQGEIPESEDSILRESASKEIAVESGYLQKDMTEAEKGSKSANKVDLNTADEALLCTLPGIGESRAKSIIAYREEHGPFQTSEDVMKVSGIKEAAYEKIKDFIMVSGQ